MEILSLVAVFITLVLLLYLLSMVWPPDSPWSPWWRTNSKRSRLICKLANVTNKDVVYDLGCGDGTLLITAAREFGAKAVGVEIDPFRVWYAKLAVLFTGQGGRVKIVRKNFFDAEIGDATVVFMYLIPKALAKLKPKLIEELKPGTRVVTFVYRIDLPVVHEDFKNEIYLYEIPKKKR
jgi:predicted RNA methylase